MWNAEIHNRYSKERIQPSIDLATRIKDMKFQRILDVGCGTGMSTAPLVLAWEKAEIIGVVGKGNVGKDKGDFANSYIYTKRLQ